MGPKKKKARHDEQNGIDWRISGRLGLERVKEITLVLIICDAGNQRSTYKRVIRHLRTCGIAAKQIYIIPLCIELTIL